MVALRVTGRSLLFGSVAVLVALALPQAGQAADTFVDSSAGDDQASCLDPAAACLTIPAAIAKAGPGDTVNVAPGSYPEHISLDEGKSLRASGAVDATFVNTLETTGDVGTIEGFTFRGAPIGVAVWIRGEGVVRRNVFDTFDLGGLRDVIIHPEGSGAPSPTVVENEFLGAGAPGGNSAVAVLTTSKGAPVIEDNTIQGHQVGIWAFAGTPEIRGNEIAGTTGIFTLEEYPVSIAAIVVTPTSGGEGVFPTLVANHIHDPHAVGNYTPPVGVFVRRRASSYPPASVTLRRNRISGGFSTGVFLVDSDPSSLHGDLITGNEVGLRAYDDHEIEGRAGVEATNLTSFGNARDIELGDAPLSLNSSIVGNQIQLLGTTSSCQITFSRGPIAANQRGCGDFATEGDPLFVNSPTDLGPDDFHLQPHSPLLDIGDPTEPHLDEVDLDGNPRASAGQCGGEALRDIGAYELSIDCDALAARITAGPGENSTTGPGTVFSFELRQPTDGVSFRCRLDDRAFEDCGSPVELLDLTDGPHAFRVKAVAEPGGGEGVPVVRSWNVDATPPAATIIAGPASGEITGAATSFSFSSTEAQSRFECRLDAANFEDCTSPKQLERLGAGPHRFEVRATDSFGNRGEGASRTWTVKQSGVVDDLAPETRFDSGPADGVLTNQPQLAYGFSSEPGVAFQCRLDDDHFAACGSPHTLLGLPDGRHSLSVRALDATGNVDPTPAARTFTLDTDPPQTRLARLRVLRSKPRATQRLRLRVRLTSDEAEVRFTCRLDLRRRHPCRPSTLFRRLRPGRHILVVRATDRAGNRDPSPVRKRFRT